MKFSKILAGLILLGVTSFAMDVKYFAGIGTGKGYWTIKGTVTKLSTGQSVSVKLDDDAGLLEIKTGALINTNHKIYFTFDNINTSSDNDLKVYGINYDYLFNAQDPKIEPYIGMAYSLLKYKETLTNDSTFTWDKNEAKLNVNAILLKLGCSYLFNPHNKISFDYSFSIYTTGDENVGVTINSEKYNEKVEVDKMSKWVISYSYLF
jgi:hypothetical protein